MTKNKKKKKRLRESTFLSILTYRYDTSIWNEADISRIQAELFAILTVLKSDNVTKLSTAMK